MNKNNFKTALFDAMSSEYDKILSESENEHKFSSKFNKKMKKLIKRRQKPYYMLINTFSKRIACVLLTVAIASSATVLSVDASRNAVADLFVELHEKFSVVQPDNKTDTPETIEDIYEITYDLSKYKIDCEDYTDYKRNIIYSKDNITIDFEQCTKKTFDENINTERANISEIDIDDHKAMYFQDNHNYDCLIWDNGDYIIKLHSNIGKNALINIAKSVQKVE